MQEISVLWPRYMWQWRGKQKARKSRSLSQRERWRRRMDLLRGRKGAGCFVIHGKCYCFRKVSLPITVQTLHGELHTYPSDFIQLSLIIVLMLPPFRNKEIGDRLQTRGLPARLYKTQTWKVEHSSSFPNKRLGMFFSDIEKYHWMPQQWAADAAKDGNFNLQKIPHLHGQTKRIQILFTKWKIIKNPCTVIQRRSILRLTARIQWIYFCK